MTFTLVMVIGSSLTIIPGFSSEEQCQLAGDKIRVEYEWRLPRTCVAVGGSKDLVVIDEIKWLESISADPDTDEISRDTANRRIKFLRSK